MEKSYYYSIESNNNLLTHYGVKGMHWGIRKASEEYNKYLDKANEELDNSSIGRLEKSWNHAAETLNNKYDDVSDPKIQREFDELVVKTYNQSLAKELKANENYKIAEIICKEYELEKYDDFVKENLSAVKEILSYYDD